MHSLPISWAQTAYAGEEYRTRALAADFQAYLPKPVNSSELIAVIASLAEQISKAQVQ